VSRETISKITDQVLEEMTAWMCRPPAPRRTGRLSTRTRLSTVSCSEVSVARAAELAPPPAMPFCGAT
jgi:hypothetical protein